MLKRLLDQGREITAAEPFAPGQIQPASIDLRLGPVAYRVRASFLPGPAATVEDKLKTVFMHEVDLSDGAVLEAGCVYIVPLLERAEFSARISGGANPKSSTGRIDVFTRLITDYAPSLRPRRAGLSRPALCRNLPPDLSGAGAQGLAPQPACASAMARPASATRRCAGCMSRRRWWHGWKASPISMTAWRCPST